MLRISPLLLLLPAIASAEPQISFPSTVDMDISIVSVHLDPGGVALRNAKVEIITAPSEIQITAAQSRMANVQVMPFGEVAYAVYGAGPLPSSPTVCSHIL